MSSLPVWLAGDFSQASSAKWTPLRTAHTPIVFLTAQDGDGDVVGVLPLILVRSRLFGRRLVSMPFLDYGGVLAEPDRGIEMALAEEALRVARERAVVARSPDSIPTAASRVSRCARKDQSSISRCPR